MNYVITGSAGNISRPLAELLLGQGHHVAIVGRSEEHLQPLIALGARSAIGTVEDSEFLTSAFKGADAVYTMIPPKWDPVDWKSYIAGIGSNYAMAIRNAGVKNVVNLSSCGAHLSEGCGPINGLHRAEQMLNSLEEVDILHLRPSYFFTNLLTNIELIKNAGIMGGNFSVDRLPLSDPADIARVAANALMDLNFAGHSVRYQASDIVNTADIARAIGREIGMPALAWVKFSDEQALQGMIAAGLSHEVAANYVEMGSAMDSGALFVDFFKNEPQVSGTSLDEFARAFALAYGGR